MSNQGPLSCGKVRDTVHTFSLTSGDLIFGINTWEILLVDLEVYLRGLYPSEMVYMQIPTQIQLLGGETSRAGHSQICVKRDGSS